MLKKEKFAKIIRTITVPPVLVLLLLLILFFTDDKVLSGGLELALSVLFLMIVPIAAYPLASIIPKYQKKGRQGQRKLGFILSLLGYTTAVVYGFASHVNEELLLVYLTYFVSVIILTVFNKLVKIRASGHACSITGPLILIVYFVGLEFLLPCILVFALIIWSSLLLKRHTPRDLFTGSLSASLAFVLSLLFVGL